MTLRLSAFATSLLITASAWAQTPTAPRQMLLQTALSSDMPAGTTFEAATLGTSALGYRDSGCVVSGRVDTVSLPRSGEPATLRLRFDSIRDEAGRQQPFSATLQDVDNAREHVEPDGTIVGLRPLAVHPSLKGDLLMAAAMAHPVILATYLGVRVERKELDRPSIRFDPGVALSVRPAAASGVPDRCRAALPQMSVPSEFSGAMGGLPQRTTAGQTPRDADWINLVFRGRRTDVEGAFERAGWLPAVKATMRADVRTFMAVAEREAYAQGPVSTLSWQGRPPDLVFQHQTDTFSKRHHIRIWAMQGDPSAATTWVAAATHDIAVEISHETHTFTHLTAPDIDDEREFVIASLVAAARVSTIGWWTRPSVPARSVNAAGDPIATDGRVAMASLAP